MDVNENIKEERWIKSKVLVIFGINNQFAGMYVVENIVEVELIMKLAYDFPYHYKLYDDIPRLNESVRIVSGWVDGLITTSITGIDGDVKSIAKHVSSLMDSKEILFKKIEETFGSK